MKLKSILLMGFAVVSLAACQKEVNNTAKQNPQIKANVDGGASLNALDYYNCGDAKTVVLRTSNDKDVGTVKITNNFSYIEVTYTVSNNWILDKTKIYIGYETNIPLYSNGTPNINNFPYKVTHPWDTEVYTLRVPRNGLTGDIVVIAQSNVLRVNKITCGILEAQCSSGVGTSFPSATGCTPQKINYTLQACTDN